MKTCKACKVSKPLAEYGRHSMTKDGLRPLCRPCAREASKEWNNANKVRVAAAGKKFRETNRRRCCEYAKAYVAKNPDKVRAKRKAYYDANKATLKEKYYRPEKGRAAASRRRAKQKQVGGTWNMDDARRILKAQRCRCAACKVRLKTKYHVDHIKPLHRGGSNYPSNLQILCKACNLRKAAKDPLDFSRELGLLC